MNRLATILSLFMSCFCLTVSSMAAEYTITDNAEASLTIRDGFWGNSSGENPYNNSSEYSLRGTFTWLVDVPRGNTDLSEYEVQAYWTDFHNRTSQAMYGITHAFGIDNVTVDQTQDGGEWVTLGTYIFNPATTSITLHNASTGTVSADAVRLIPVNNSSNSNSFINKERDFFALVDVIEDRELWLGYGGYRGTRDPTFLQANTRTRIGGPIPLVPLFRTGGNFGFTPAYSIVAPNVVANNELIVASWFELNSLGITNEFDPIPQIIKTVSINIATGEKRENTSRTFKGFYGSISTTLDSNGSVVISAGIPDGPPPAEPSATYLVKYDRDLNILSQGFD